MTGNFCMSEGRNLLQFGKSTFGDKREISAMDLHLFDWLVNFLTVSRHKRKSRSRAAKSRLKPPALMLKTLSSFQRSQPKSFESRSARGPRILFSMPQNIVRFGEKSSLYQCRDLGRNLGNDKSHADRDSLPGPRSHTSNYEYAL